LEIPKNNQECIKSVVGSQRLSKIKHRAESIGQRVSPSPQSSPARGEEGNRENAKIKANSKTRRVFFVEYYKGS
jgi:hypothetical protein